MFTYLIEARSSTQDGLRAMLVVADNRLQAEKSAKIPSYWLKYDVICIGETRSLDSTFHREW